MYVCKMVLLTSTRAINTDNTVYLLLFFFSNYKTKPQEVSKLEATLGFETLWSMHWGWRNQIKPFTKFHELLNVHPCNHGCNHAFKLKTMERLICLVNPGQISLSLKLNPTSKMEQLFACSLSYKCLSVDISCSVLWTYPQLL